MKQNGIKLNFIIRFCMMTISILSFCSHYEEEKSNYDNYKRCKLDGRRQRGTLKYSRIVNKRHIYCALYLLQVGILYNKGIYGQKKKIFWMESDKIQLTDIFTLTRHINISSFTSRNLFRLFSFFFSLLFCILYLYVCIILSCLWANHAFYFSFIK